MGLSEEELELMKSSDIQLNCPHLLCFRCFNMSHLILVATILFLFLINQLLTKKIYARLTKMYLRRLKNEPKEKKSQAICPICQSSFQDRALIDGCQHEYCFGCIVRWSQVGHRDCPCCRRSFDRVKHNIRSDTEFDWHWTNRCAELKYKMKMFEQHVNEFKIDSDSELIPRRNQLKQHMDQLKKDLASWNVLVWFWALWHLFWVTKEMVEFQQLQNRYYVRVVRLKNESRILRHLCLRHEQERGR